MCVVIKFERAGLYLRQNLGNTVHVSIIVVLVISCFIPVIPIISYLRVSSY